MRLRVAIALLAAILIAASDAAAAETQLSPDLSFGISATPGWVSWGRDVNQNGIRTEWVLWRAGSFVPVAQPYERTLGTDAKGRAVALETPCFQCSAVERRLADGSVRPLPRRVVHVADESGGTLAYVRRNLGIYVLRPGARRVMRVSRADAASVALGPRWLVYWDRGGSDNTSRIVAIDLKPSRPRARVVATYSSAEDDCGCTNSFARGESPTIDGHVAYWVETQVTRREPQGQPAVHTTLLRVDLAARHPVVEAFSPSQLVNDFAVERGTIYYTKTSPYDTSRGVFRVDSPKWEKTTRRFPVRS